MCEDNCKVNLKIRKEYFFSISWNINFNIS